MGKENYLIEGVSGTGKTSVAEELQRRGWIERKKTYPAAVSSF